MCLVDLVTTFECSIMTMPAANCMYITMKCNLISITVVEGYSVNVQLISKFLASHL